MARVLAVGSAWGRFGDCSGTGWTRLGEVWRLQRDGLDLPGGGLGTASGRAGLAWGRFGDCSGTGWTRRLGRRASFLNPAPGFWAATRSGGIWARWTGDPIAGRKRVEREGECCCFCLVACAFHVPRKGAPKAGHRAATSLWAAAGPGKNPQLWARASALG